MTRWRDRQPGETYWSNLMWFVAAVISIGVGAVCFGVWIARRHFGDAKVLLDAGDHLAAGLPLYSSGYVYEFLYPPLAAAVGSVMRLVPDSLLIEFAVRLIVVGWGAWLLSRGYTTQVRALFVLVAVTSIPFVEDSSKVTSRRGSLWRSQPSRGGAMTFGPGSRSG